MNVYLPFHPGDVEAAKRLVQWMHDLGGAKNHNLFLLADGRTDFGSCFGMQHRAKQPESPFTEAEVLVCPPVDGWIAGSNSAWLKAAHHAQEIAKVPYWLFLEPDAVPTRKGWLEAIEEEYKASGARYMGPVVTHDRPNLPSPYLEGCAVYPGNAWAELKGTVESHATQSWTLSTAGQVVSQARDSRLFQHLWGEKGNPPTFAYEGRTGTNIFGLSYIRPEAALFHRNKDGSLINLLRRRIMGLPDIKKVNGFPAKREIHPPEGIIILGRHGDLMIALRGLYLMHKWNGVRPYLVCSKEYSSILDGVGYVAPRPLGVHWWTGMPEARRLYPKASVIQCHASGLGVDLSKWPNYMTSMWDRMGCPVDLLKEAPLVFDRRDAESERLLLKANRRQPSAPLVLYNFTGVSSPFAHQDIIRSLIAKSAPECEIVDLGKVKGRHIYDLLALYEAADLLVTSDTATLHLANAAKVPTIGFIVDGWSGSVPPITSVLDIRYADVPRRLDEIGRVIRACLTRKTSTIVHCFSHYPGVNEDAARRQMLAAQTWQKQSWVEAPIRDESLPRLWTEGTRKLPYIVDVLDAGCEGLGKDDICVYTNADIFVRSDCSRVIADRLKNQGACYANRYDFGRLDRTLPDSEITKGQEYCGTDLFAFTVRWWQEHRREMPDLIIGCEAWDACLRVLMVLTNPGKQLAIPGLIYHERHGGSSHWENPANRYKWQGQIRCLRLAHQWMLRHGQNPDHFGIRKV